MAAEAEPPTRGPAPGDQGYDRVLVEPAPLPPHERTWRHPSEIGPSRAELERDGQGRPILLAATALAAIVLVATVVAMTPRPTAGPSAISATTKPMPVEPAAASAGAQPATQIISAMQAPRLATFAPIPNAVAATPDAGRDPVVVARSVPAGRDLVHVRTDDVTYRVAWADLAFVELIERALVFDVRGDLVARIVDGELVVLVD